MSKKAVVLFNLGGPDSPNAIRPFLINFFMDRNIIRLPVPWRCLIAVMIANRRSKKEAGESYGALGGASPLLANSRTQAQALEEVLGKDYRVFVCMRYWHPMAPQIVREVRDWGADEIILLPLYPQFSTTTTWSSYEQWRKACFEAGYEKPTSLICCYPFDEGFIAASAALVREYYEQTAKQAADKGLPAPRVLFSAHGLPESVIRQGDPYQWQCEQGAENIAAATGIAGLDWQICYQSRVGPKKWIGPGTGDALEKAAKDNVPVVVYPHAFTQEHVETLVEIEIEYRELAEELGVPLFTRVPTVGVHEAYIEGLAALVKARAGHTGIASDTGARLCGRDYKDCCFNRFETMAQEKKWAA